jgi:virulence factor Mce-like protein
MNRSNVRLGVVALALLTAATFLLYLYVAGTFKSGYIVTASFERAGQLLRGGSDVKLRGVLVGEVEAIQVQDDGTAQVRMRMFADHQIPSNVSAAIRAKTLFGEKFVELRIPDDPSGRLAQGDEIPLDRTTGPIEVETILERGVPVLAAIDPEMFAAAMNALARGFVGNEDALRRATGQSADFLDATAQTLPEFERNMQHLRNFSDAVDRADDDLLRTLDALEEAGGTVNRNSAQLREVLRHLPALSRDLGDIFGAREQDLVLLAEQGAPVLELVASRANDLPQLLQLVDGFLGVWIVDLSAGPYWRIFVTSDPADAHPYSPGTGPGPRATSTQAQRRAFMRDIGMLRDNRVPALAELMLSAVPASSIPGVVP